MELLRFINLTVAVVSAVLAVFWMRNNRRWRWMLLAPLTVVIHIMIYYICRVCNAPISVLSLNFWSSTIHLHILILFLLGLALFWRTE